jgi:hypothetical protein
MRRHCKSSGGFYFSDLEVNRHVWPLQQNVVKVSPLVNNQNMALLHTAAATRLMQCNKCTNE